MRYKVECRGCGRFMFYAIGTVKLEGYVCPNNKCKAKQNVDITLAIEIMATEKERVSRLAIIKDKEGSS